jgi:hypothetical protein
VINDFRGGGSGCDPFKVAQRRKSRRAQFKLSLGVARAPAHFILIFLGV